MNENGELIALSYLSQYGYCPRRAGLLMLDCIWTENVFTVEGSIAHERAHSGGIEARSGCIKMFDMPLVSSELGLTGKTDCLEAHPDKNGVLLKQYSGKYRLYPVEYKHGVVRNEKEYHIQLCGQAMCLEEMLGCYIETGALYFTGNRKREEIVFNSILRDEVIDTASKLHKMLAAKVLPPATKSSKCYKCSLNDVCMPTLIKKNAREYVNSLIEWAKEGDDS